MANGQPINYAAPYFAEKERSRQEMNQRAAYAAAIAEAAGGYTPELERQVLAPLGQYPTVGENLIAAPIRGLGKLFGSERLQQIGAPQPFQLGPTAAQQQVPTMPPLPEGLDPGMRQALESIAATYGLQTGREPTTTPNIPSETSGRAKLKTKTERSMEAEGRKAVWDFLAQHYQSEQDRQLAEAKIQQMQQASMESQARIREIDARIKRGLPVTEWQLVQQFMEEEGINLEEAQRRLSKFKGNKPALQQLYEYAKNNEGFTGTLADYQGTLQRSKWNLIDAAGELFYTNPIMPFKVPLEQHPEFIARIASGLNTAMGKVYANPDIKIDEPDGGEGQIPAELEAQGVKPRDVQNLIEFEELEGNKITWSQAIQMYMDYLKKRGANNATGGTANAGTTKPKSAK